MKWPSTDISVSFMPDGTMIGTQKSNLFATYMPLYVPWREQFIAALEKWAQVTPICFRIVSDNGLPQGTLPLVAGQFQGDSRFGDIRLGAFPTSLAYATTYYPYQTTTRGGDITLNSSKPYMIGANPDLFTILLHEVGHALGLAHSSVFGAVMYPLITGVYVGLQPDDITSIQQLYGPRRPDQASIPLVTGWPLP